MARVALITVEVVDEKEVMKRLDKNPNLIARANTGIEKFGIIATLVGGLPSDIKNAVLLGEK